MTDAEYTVEVPAISIDDLSKWEISVDKIGGGTVGSSYTGTWEITYYIDGRLMDTETMNTGTPKTHKQVAQIYASYLASYSEGSQISDRLSLFAEDE